MQFLANRSNLKEKTRSTLCHIRREYASRRFGFRVFIDSMFLETACGWITAILNDSSALNSKRSRIVNRRAKAVEARYGVKYIACAYFPPDIIWGDYSQVDSFLPSPHSVVIDVGANIGDWSIIVAKFYNAFVVAVEPVVSLFKNLEMNVQLNSLNNCVKLVNCALGDHAGTVHLNYDANTGYASASDGRDRTEGEEKADNYPVETLDNLVTRLNLQSLDLVKIDVEGNEFAVLKGSTQTIVRFKPKIIVEVHSPLLKKQVLELMSQYNYLLIHEKVNFHNSISVLYLQANH
jgi:FkbM family methyltransferase